MSQAFLSLQAILFMASVTSPTQRLPSQPAKVVVLIHGAGGGGWEWDKWIPTFKKEGWVCLNYDLIPNTKGIAKTEFADYANQVKNWVKPHQPCRLVMIGASMGGILALKASEDLHPDALVLVNSVGPKGFGHPKASSYPSVIEWSKGTLKETRDSMPDSDESTIQFAFKHWRDESGRVLNTISNGVSVVPPICPLLVVLGAKDTDVPNAVGRAMAKQFMGDLKVYRGMSHVGPLLGTRAPEVALDTLTWLNKHVR